MKPVLFALEASLTTSVVVMCLFSMVYLASVSWGKNRWLVLGFFIHFWIVFTYMMSSRVYGIIPDSSFLLNPAPLILFFPALYFYTQDLVQPNAISTYQRLPHFLPFAVLYIIGVSVGFDAPMATYMREANVFFMQSFMGVNLAIVLFYSYHILQLVRLNQHKYKQQYANSNPYLSLQWIKWMLYLLVVTPFLGAFFNLLFRELFGEGEIMVVVFSMLMGTTTLAFFTFRQPILYREEQKEIERQEIQKKLQKTSPQPSPKPTEAATLNISDTEKAAYLSKIQTYMEEERPYLNPKIRMPELAHDLHIPRHVFSFVINEHYQMNFFNLINKYRVEYAKKLLKDKDYELYTLETIGEMAGFNSRSTFNKRFKELTGMSPGNFQKE